MVLQKKHSILAERIIIFFLIFAIIYQLLPDPDNLNTISIKPVFPAIDEDRIVFENHQDWTYSDLVIWNNTSGIYMPFKGIGVTRYKPDIDGEIIVWQEKIDNIWDIYMKNISSDKITPVYQSQFRKTSPRVSGDWIVFVDEKFGNEDIHLVSLSNHEDRMICQAEDIQWQPDIDGDWVVWEDWRNGAQSRGDIFAYHIPTGKEIQVTDSSWGDWFPSVSGEWVVW